MALSDNIDQTGGYLRSGSGLARAGLIDPAAVALADAVAQRYAISVSADMAALIDPAEPNDPIARQFLPDARELIATPGELTDPIGDEAHAPVKGIVHRYPDRVLLKPLTICPVYCRFCFRRETVGPGNGGLLASGDLDRAFAYIESRPEIWEVILTGGDPLGLSPRRLTGLMRRLAGIEHVRTVRIHTRVPAVDPARIDAAMVAAIKTAGKPVFVALHANHPREMTPAARAACARLIDAGIPMISQSVLLKGVNDDTRTLAALMRCFVENRIKPYYLHHPDLAPGTSHFRIDLDAGKQLVESLRGHISGLAMPHYVVDIPGGYGKSPVTSDYVTGNADDGHVLRDRLGAQHKYTNGSAAARLEASPHQPRKTGSAGR